MAANICHSFVCFVFVLAIAFQIPTSSGQLTTNYYANSCPRASDIVAEVVQNATKYDPRMGASLLRLHFHDCFVNGCDGSVLLADTPTFTGEQTAVPNNNSLRGFDVVAKINAALNKQCGCVVSCADMLAMAARYSVADLGGPGYDVLLGRKDSKNASFAAVLQNLPSPFSNFAALVANFASHSLNLTDLVVLSGAHTIGFARCINFMTRIYKDGDINATFAGELQQVCPNNPNSVNATSVLWPLDNTTKVFDKKYYEMLQQETGLLHSDQELYSGGNSTSANLVTYFSNNQDAFFEAFKVSIIKMGNLPPSNNNTEIRCNCSIPNSPSPPPPSPPPPSPSPPPPSPPPPSPPPPTPSSPNSGISISVNLSGISVSIP